MTGHGNLIVITAGGTGGHLFPAQALAEELRARERKVVLITDARGLKWRDAFPETDLHTTLAATTERPGLLNKLSAVIKLGLGMLQALRLLLRYKPKIVVGFGGYPTLPTMFAAIAKGTSTCLHEQNGVMGRANRLIAPRVTAIALTFPDPIGLQPRDAAKAEVTGNPVRAQVISAADTPYPSLDNQSPLRLIIFGGSQGAHIFSEVVPAAIGLLPAELKQRLSIVQQCREDDLQTAQAGYDEIGLSVELESFFTNLPELMADAHLIISRSGASTVCELAVLGRPSILVPLPGALDQDQAANAKVLAGAGGAWILPQDQFTAETLSARLSELLQSADALPRAAAAAKSQGLPHAVSALADLVERKAGFKVAPAFAVEA